VRLHSTQGVFNSLSNPSTAISDAQGKCSRKSFFHRMVGARTAFFASDWLEGLSFHWLFDLALKRFRVRVVMVRVRVVVVRVRVRS
jgi:hypothetical protein